jgi:alkaline phosphatase
MNLMFGFLMVLPVFFLSPCLRARERIQAERKQAIPRYHSHNDYLHEHPLVDAIRAGVSSVEADVWKYWDGLFVSHFPVFGKSGSLDSWYLEPWSRSSELQESEKWDYLWMDIKGPASGVKGALLERLKNLFLGEGSPRPVIVLTGDTEVKRELATLLNKIPEVSGRILRDAEEVSVSDPLRQEGRDPWGWYSLSWPDRYSWDGKGCMPSGEWDRLKREIALVRAKRRQVRYFHVPNTVNWIRMAEEAGVDLIDVDDLSLPGKAAKGASDPRLQICQ